jgi:hypothetical protein
MSQLDAGTEEFCPSCGKFVTVIVPDTGWCETCSGIITRICVKCKAQFTSKTEDFVCSTCLADQYDDIEVLIVNGLSITRAKALVAQVNRAFCLCCGDYMARALKGRHHFCTKKPECRRAARRLKYYREMLGMEKESALNRVLDTLRPAEETEVKIEHRDQTAGAIPAGGS